MAGEEKIFEFIVTEEEAGMRLDQFLALSLPDYSRTYIQKLIKAGQARVGERHFKPSYLLNEQDNVILEVPPPETWILEPEPIPLDIVYEDDHIIVINKKAGMVVHPAPGNRTGTLVHALLSHCPALSGIGGVLRPGIIHRLDKNTTGLLIVAKTDLAHLPLVRQMTERSIKRIYIALVTGNMKENSGTINVPIGRNENHRERMAVNHKTGKTAITHYRVLKRSEGLTLLEISLETGRTHQIRVHLAYIGHPVVGDPEYGFSQKQMFCSVPVSHSLLIGKLKKVKMQMLHATRLEFRHPITGDDMKLEAPPPGLFRELIDVL